MTCLYGRACRFLMLGSASVKQMQILREIRKHNSAGLMAERVGDLRT